MSARATSPAAARRRRLRLARWFRPREASGEDSGTSWRDELCVGDVAPAVDVGRFAWRRADVAGGRAHEASGALLLYDVGALAGCLGAGEYCRHHVWRH